MRGRPFNISAIGRALGFAFVVAAIVAAALHVQTSEPGIQGLQVTPTTSSDPLTEELQRCRALATQAKDDAGCEAAWAENRRRFFTYQPAPNAATSPAASPQPSDR
jgi:conjugative transfer region protein TrbK